MNWWIFKIGLMQQCRVENSAAVGARCNCYPVDQMAEIGLMGHKDVPSVPPYNWYKVQWEKTGTDCGSCVDSRGKGCCNHHHSKIHHKTFKWGANNSNQCSMIKRQLQGLYHCSPCNLYCNWQQEASAIGATKQGNEPARMATSVSKYKVPLNEWFVLPVIGLSHQSTLGCNTQLIRALSWPWKGHAPRLDQYQEMQLSKKGRGHPQRRWSSTCDVCCC